jgi:hypothetical protein
MKCACRHELARELGHEALFDEGVEAARNACVAGAPLASAAITASAWYDNPLTGAPALRECLRRLSDLPRTLGAFASAFRPRIHPKTEDADWSPGFGFVTAPQTSALLAASERLRVCVEACVGPGWLAFFVAHSRAIEGACGPLNAAGLTALVFADHAGSADAAERTFLVARLDVALAEAALARAAGLARFPFFSKEHVFEGSSPAPRRFDLEALMQRVGL